MELFVFDMAGTTIHDENKVGLVLQSALKAFDFDLSIEEINVVMGYEKPVAISELLKSKSHPYTDELIDQIHDLFVNDMIEYYKTSEDVRPTKNAEEIINYLRSKNIKVGFDTGFSRVIADTIFEKLNWKQGRDFDFSITSDEVENGRPYPDMIFKTMEKLNISDSSLVAKVGDTISDLEQGKNANCGLVIGVTTGTYSFDELSGFPHNYIIDDLIEIKKFI